MQKLTNQSEWIDRAKEVLPAGGFGNFDPSIFIREGRGSRVWDEDGNEISFNATNLKDLQQDNYWLDLNTSHNLSHFHYSLSSEK